MAVMTTDDFSLCIDWIRGSQFYPDLKNSGLLKQALFDAFQGTEDYIADSVTVTPGESLGDTLSTATAQTNTVQEEFAIVFGWAAWKVQDES